MICLNPNSWTAAFYESEPLQGCIWPWKNVGGAAFRWLAKFAEGCDECSVICDVDDVTQAKDRHHDADGWAVDQSNDELLEVDESGDEPFEPFG